MQTDENLANRAEQPIRPGERVPAPGFFRVWLHQRQDSPVGTTGWITIILHDESGAQLYHDTHTLTQDAWSASQTEFDVYCSVVVGYKGPARWLTGSEMAEYAEVRKHDPEPGGGGRSRRPWTFSGQAVSEPTPAAFPRFSGRRQPASRS